jgi:hypothetical protein
MKSNQRELKLLYRLKVKKVDGSTSKTAFGKKMRIYSLYKHEKISEWTLEVVYQKDVNNSGTFKARGKMLEAFRQWTEPELIAFIEAGEWD